MTEGIDVGEVMARRFALVEEIGVIAGRHKGELAPLNEELGLCESFIKEHMIASGMTQVKTDAGMTFFTTKDSVTVDDMDKSIHFMLAAAPRPVGLVDADSTWQQILDHLYAHGMWGLLNKALNKTAVKELLEATPPVPAEALGVRYSSFKDLSWRKGKA